MTVSHPAARGAGAPPPTPPAAVLLAHSRKPNRPMASRRQEARAGLLAVVLALGFLAIATQLTRLAIAGSTQIRLAQAEAVGRTTARPDIVDRQGRLLATDITTPSLVADPHYIQGLDETIEALKAALPSLDAAELRKQMRNRQSRFAWLKRGMRPDEAQRVFNLGLPGISFRDELRRIYPAAELTGHLLGAVNRDNHGISGIESYLDATGIVDSVDRPLRSTREPVVLSIDLAVQSALRSELKSALRTYHASGAAGLLIDIKTGEVLAASSLPDFASGDAEASADKRRLDRVSIGAYELGSVFKTLTLAMALDSGSMTLGSTFDTTAPIVIGKQKIDDDHPTRRLLSFEEVFLKSSNIAASQMADALGEVYVRQFLKRLGLLEPLVTEAGRVTPVRTSSRWGRVGTMTVSFGHGIAVTPLQFAVATAALFNGGLRIKPTFLKRLAADGAADAAPVKVLKSSTVAAMRKLMRANVVDDAGTGKLADVIGYEVGGKTGTADIAGAGGYGNSGVLTSFLAVFPASQPRYLTYVLLFQPQATKETNDQRVAALNAAPATARIIARVAPILGLKPVYAPGGT